MIKFSQGIIMNYYYIFYINVYPVRSLISFLHSQSKRPHGTAYFSQLLILERKKKELERELKRTQIQNETC